MAADGHFEKVQTAIISETRYPIHFMNIYITQYTDHTMTSDTIGLMIVDDYEYDRRLFRKGE